VPRPRQPLPRSFMLAYVTPHYPILPWVLRTDKTDLDSTDRDLDSPRHTSGTLIAEQAVHWRTWMFNLYTSCTFHQKHVPRYHSCFIIIQVIRYIAGSLPVVLCAVLSQNRTRPQLFIIVPSSNLLCPTQSCTFPDVPRYLSCLSNNTDT
jgi:hypothetical protein